MRRWCTVLYWTQMTVAVIVGFVAGIVVTLGFVAFVVFTS